MPHTLSHMLPEQAVVQTGDMLCTHFGQHRCTASDPEFQAPGVSIKRDFEFPSQDLPPKPGR
jgi:hypothetical protein